MANPQPDDPHLRIAHSISEQIMMRNFTKRRRAILDLILRLSWGCNKKYAIIPKLSDFEIVGVSRSHIREELEWLQNAKVIFWNEPTNQFWFNKDYDQWAVSLVTGYDKEKLNKLININIKDSQNHILNQEQCSQNSNNVPEENREQCSQNGNIVPETGTMFPKKSNFVPEISEHFDPANPCESKAEGTLKESIIESNKERSLLEFPHMGVTQQIILTQEESKFIEILSSIPNYPLDREKDLKMYNKMKELYPQLDLLEAANSFYIHILDKPFKKGCNPRGQFHTHCKKQLEWGKCLKRKPESQRREIR